MKYFKITSPNNEIDLMELKDDEFVLVPPSYEVEQISEKFYKYLLTKS